MNWTDCAEKQNAFYVACLPKASMANKIPEDEAELIQAVLNLAIENLAFRKGLLIDPAATIDRFSQALKFDSHKLSLEAMDLIGSITQEELQVMERLSDKAKYHNARGVKFPL